MGDAQYPRQEETGQHSDIVHVRRDELTGHLENSRPLDVHKRSDYPEVKRAVDTIMEAVLQLGIPRLAALRLDSPKHRRQLHDHFKVVIIDLYVACSENDDKTRLQHVLGRPFVGYSRDKNDYLRGGRYASLHIKYRYLVAAVDGLIAAGYVEHKLGFYDRRTGVGRQSRMRATPKLLELILTHRVHVGMVRREHPLVVLRDKDGKGIDISHMPQAMRLLPDIELVNQMLADTRISLNLTHTQRVELLTRCHVDPTRITAYRVFNGDFHHGGRYYGLWVQSLPREYRRHLNIQGLPVVEADFASMHPRLLYATEGKTPPPGDLYALDDSDVGYRPVVKVLFNTLINAASERSAVNSLCFCKGDQPSLAQQFGLTIRQVVQLVSAIKTKHAPIARHFGTGAGLGLQFLDSEIAKGVMLRLWQEGIHSLPLHDSFLVAAPHAGALMAAMSNVSAEHLHGVILPADIKHGAEFITSSHGV